MSKNDKEYDPNQIDKNLRRKTEELDKYLAKKGLKCVDVEEIKKKEMEDEERERIEEGKDYFLIGQYYTTGTDEDAFKHLPDFQIAIDDEDVQFEFFGWNSHEPFNDNYSISYKILNKKKFTEDYSKFFHNYRGLLESKYLLPEIEAYYVVKKPPPTDAVTHHAVTYHSGEKIIQESRVKEVLKIDPKLFEKSYSLLKLTLKNKSVVFDLSEYYSWRRGWKRRK